MEHMDMEPVVHCWSCLCPELKGGVPVLSVNHGSGTLTLQLRPESSTADRRWHRLDISSDGKVGAI